MCSDAPSPDPAIGEAAKANAAIAQEALAYYKAKDIANQPRQDAADALATKLSNQQLDTSEFNTAQAKEQWQRYQDKSVPVEDQMFKDATSYDSPERLEQMAAEAGTDVASNMATAKAGNARDMARMGVNPNSGRFAASADQMAATEALGEAAAENSGRQKVRDMGIMLRKDASNFGRGMTSTAAQTYGVAQQAGSSAAGALTNAANMSNAATAQMGTGFGTAINGNQSVGNMLNGQLNAQTAAVNGNNASTAATAGTVATIGIAI